MSEDNLEQIYKFVSFEEVNERCEHILKNDSSISLEDAMKQAIKEVYIKNKTKDMLKDRPDLQNKMKKFGEILKKYNR